MLRTSSLIQRAHAQTNVNLQSAQPIVALCIIIIIIIIIDIHTTKGVNTNTNKKKNEREKKEDKVIGLRTVRADHNTLRVRVFVVSDGLPYAWLSKQPAEVSTLIQTDT